jgi:ABC-type Na+ transport system ATPase subunit NatA
MPACWVIPSATTRWGQIGAGSGPQEIAVYEDLTAHENLTFWGKMYGLRGAQLKTRVSEVLETIGLSERAGERVGKYSGGMKRRVNIGVALLHKPQVIYMDEPTVGIDPQSRRNILDSVVALMNQGMTVPLHHALHGGSPGTLRPYRHHGSRQLRSPWAPQRAWSRSWARWIVSR